MKTLLTCLTIASSSACFAGPWCGPSEAFGIAYGSKPPQDAKLESKGNAANWYELRAEGATPTFDKLQIRANSATLETLEVIASKRITPERRASDGPLPMELRVKGKELARAFTLQYVSQLPPEMQSRLSLQRYMTATWKGMISDDILMTISGDDHWTVTVSCESMRLQSELARRVVPELFQKPSK